MSITLEHIDFESVSGMLRNCLGLDDSDKINPDTTLKSLCVEDLDFLDFFYKMGVNLRKYIIDFESRRLDYPHILRDFLTIAVFEGRRGNKQQYKHIVDLCQKSNKELLAGLNVADCVSIGQYMQQTA